MKHAWVAFTVLAMMATAAQAFAQRDTEEEPSCLIYFQVIKDDNGKPVRNAAVIMHPVNNDGKQGHGGMELKTDAEGKTSFDGVPYGKLRVQVLAQGFQTYGDDFDVTKPKMSLTIKLKRPQGQYSIYEDHSKDSGGSTQPPASSPPPPADKKNDKPN